MRSSPGAARTILLFHIVSARPPKQPLFFFHGLGLRMHLCVEVTELSTNKQHHVVYWYSIQEMMLSPWQPVTENFCTPWIELRETECLG